MKKYRIFYAVAFGVLLGIEVLIALFVNDAFVRPYLGDVLVVIVLYCLVGAFLPQRIWKRLFQTSLPILPGIVFLFAALVEFLQGIHIVERLGLEQNATANTIIGTSFDWKDLLCYLTGCVMLAGWEWLIRRKISQS